MISPVYYGTAFCRTAEAIMHMPLPFAHGQGSRFQVPLQHIITRKLARHDALPRHATLDARHIHGIAATRDARHAYFG